MNEKIKQFRQKLTCECPGYPKSLGDGRIKCERKIVIDLELGQSYMQNRRTIAKKMEKHGWHKLKTLGNFQSFCLQCSDHIMHMRAENKAKWG